MTAVEPMAEKHLPALAQIEQECFHAPWSEAALREELGCGIFLAAVQDGKAIGYIGCQTVLDEGYITNVAVTPRCRRQGAARLLLAQLLKQAEKQGLSFVTLEVRASNAPAIALYQSMGFKKVGVRKKFYTQPIEDAELMTWESK